MRLKKMVVALVACVALTAVMASAAPAAWFMEGAVLGEAAQEDVKVVAGTSFTLTGKIANVPVKVTAQKLECTAGATCSIDGSKFGTDHTTATLTFTEVTVDEPLNCTVEGETIKTNQLTDELIMDPTGGLATLDRFSADSGTIATIKFLGAACPIAGNRLLKGTITGGTQRTSTFLVNFPIDFNAAEQATGEGKLTLAGEPATLTGEAILALSGANAGKVFGATE